MSTQTKAQLHTADPAKVIAALPYLVGFHPRDSLVLLTLTGEPGRPMAIGWALRVDLPPPGREHELAVQLVSRLTMRRPTAVMMVVVGGGQPDLERGLPGRQLVNTMSRMLATWAIDVANSWWTPAVEAGAQWSCIAGCCDGVLPDPASTPFAARSAANGLVAYADRSELARLVAADPAPALRRCRRLLDVELETWREGMASQPRAMLRRGRGLVVDAVAAAARDQPPTHLRALARLAAALADNRIRDWSLRCCRGARLVAAERVWQSLTRSIPAPEVANPATLAAYCAYVRGDGVLAGMALERALSAQPGHNLATLLAVALDGALPPATVAALAGDAAADAELTMLDDLDDQDVLAGQDGSGEPDAGVADAAGTGSAVSAANPGAGGTVTERGGSA